MSRLFIALLLLPLFVMANMSQLFNIERFDVSNPALLTQVEEEGLHAILEGRLESLSESFFDTQVSQTNTTELAAKFYEIKGDWTLYASLNEAINGLLSDPRDSTIDDIGIFKEDFLFSAAKIINQEWSAGLAYKLNRYGTYIETGNTFLTARNNLWLSAWEHQIYGGLTYAVSATEMAGATAGIDISHSNHTTLGWRFFGGAGISSRILDGLLVEYGTKFFPRQYTIGDTLASNFMPQYWQHEIQAQTEIDDFKISLLFDVGVEEGLQTAISDKLIKRYEFQIKKALKDEKQIVLFAAYETAIQDSESSTRTVFGASYSLIFD